MVIVIINKFCLFLGISRFDIRKCDLRRKNE
jgi:hypothetical protein